MNNTTHLERRYGDLFDSIKVEEKYNHPENKWYMAVVFTKGDNELEIETIWVELCFSANIDFLDTEIFNFLKEIRNA